MAMVLQNLKPTGKIPVCRWRLSRESSGVEQYPVSSRSKKGHRQLSHHDLAVSQLFAPCLGKSLHKLRNTEVLQTKAAELQKQLNDLADPQPFLLGDVHVGYAPTLYWVICGNVLG